METTTVYRNSEIPIITAAALVELWLTNALGFVVDRFGKYLCSVLDAPELTEYQSCGNDEGLHVGTSGRTKIYIS